MIALLATALGLKFRDGVVLAADRRVSYGGFVYSRSMKKVFPVNDRVGVAFAGLPADFQELYDSLIYNVRIFELDEMKQASPVNVAKLLSLLLYGRRLSVLMYAEVVVGGMGPSGPQIVTIDAAGGTIEEDFASEGSGAQLSTGILEREYKPGMTEREAVKLAVRAMKAAIERDSLSGDGIDLLIIKGEGISHRFLPVRMSWERVEI